MKRSEKGIKNIYTFIYIDFHFGHVNMLNIALNLDVHNSTMDVTQPKHIFSKEKVDYPSSIYCECNIWILDR